MTDTVITGPDQLTPRWFDEVLARADALRSGGVDSVEVQPEAADNSRLVRVRLRYRPGSTGACPTKLLLKLVGGGGSFGPSEVDYYARDYADLVDAPLPRCYDARYSATGRRYHLLLDDLGETHRNNWDSPPSGAYGRAVADALAALHGHRWGPERLCAVRATLPGPAEVDRYLAQVEPGLEPMLASAAGAIDARWAGVLREVFVRHPPLLRARTQEPAGFTLVHGDVNPGNVLSPRAGPGRTYLIDRQPFDWSLTTWLGVADVAYLMVHWWDTELRRRFELPTLRHYHEGLLRGGVGDYPWPQLVRDYKLCAVQSIYVAVEWCVSEEDRDGMRWVWLPQLEKAMAAFVDLGCADLWE